jgi:sialate O-acetylesterase
MLAEWRKMPGWAATRMLFVQLSTWDNGGKYEDSPLAAMRNEQFASASQNPVDFAMITAADLGDPTSPYQAIHPRNKEEVARRLSLAAGSLLYKNPVQHMGAMPVSCQAIPDAALGFKVRVKFASGGGSLHLQVVLDAAVAGVQSRRSCAIAA